VHNLFREEEQFKTKAPGGKPATLEEKGREGGHLGESQRDDHSRKKERISLIAEEKEF